MTDDDAMRGFVQQIRRSAHRPRSRRPEPESQPADHRDHLRRMLRDALAPTEPEPTWMQRFPGRADLTAELFGNTDNPEEKPTW